MGPGRGVRARARATAKIGVQLGHSGRKGSTKLMWEGIDEPLPGGQLGGRRAVADPVLAGQPGAARAHPRRPAGDPRAVRRGRPRRRPRRVRRARAARRARVPAVVVRVAAVQHPHRRLRGAAGAPPALPAGGLRRGPRGVPRAADRADLGDRLVRGGHRRRRRGRGRAGLRRARRGRDRRLHRAGASRPSDRRTGAATRPPTPTGSATRWAASSASR